jgi:hypothetical protein
MRRTPVIGLVFVIGGLLAGCASLPSQPTDSMPPGKVLGSSVVTTAAPEAGGPRSVTNCPTLAEAAAAVPVLVGGPDANAVPFKTMVLQCSYTMNERDVQGRPAGIAILVFDASAEGIHLWDPVRTDPNFPNPTDIPGLADVAFTTGVSGHYDLWVVQGGYGFHMSHLRQSAIQLDQMVALARAMLTGLSR